MTRRSPAGKGFRHLRYVAVVATASLLLLEFLLHVGAWIVSDLWDTMPSERGGGTRLVLCIGDSNTYGLYLPQEASYPSQLERLWNDHGDGPVEFVNLGYPGTNSSRALATYREALRRIQPDLALVMIGANDPWTQPLEGARGDSIAGSLLEFLKSNSRLYRFYLIQRAGQFDPAKLRWTEVPGVDFRSPEFGEAVRDEGSIARWLARRSLGDGISAPIFYEDSSFPTGFRLRESAAIDMQAGIDSTRANLEELISLSERSGVDLYIMTYPAKRAFYGPINTIIRRTARRSGAQLVDLERSFSALCAEATACDDLFFPDGHPTKKGYERVAAELDRRIRRKPTAGSATVP